ncbi:PREDICTED: methyltransferase-like protein 25 [Crocodylus porosus]|uniref:Methyltransferase like 25 n=1 Tax=Crocodylus porosus TaxID=8502 RepID=A0A7M4FSJ5_CROPO|nr:PREDICTED: methyltransferase-like protein 25 [Crocodylus porosus]
MSPALPRRQPLASSLRACDADWPGGGKRSAAEATMPRSGGPLPPEPGAEAVGRRLRGAAHFLARALPLSRAHTVDFYTRGLWAQLVALSPDAVLRALRESGPLRLQRPLQEAAGAAAAGPGDDCEFSTVFCEKTQKLVNMQAFVLAAKYHSVPDLEVCTPLEQMLEALNGKQEGRSEMKTDEFMNDKKSHEVQVMSQLVDSIADFYGIKQVIDLGSGKGYLSSFLSMQYNLKVYGIDSSSTNTHGANERNRKLKKHWRAYQSRAKTGVKGQVLEEAKKGPVEDEMKCKSNINEDLLNANNHLHGEDHLATSASIPLESAGIFTDSAMSKTSKQTELHGVAQLQSYKNKLSENAFSIMNILPSDAIEGTSSSKNNYLELSEDEKEQRKMASIKARGSKSNESNIYFPLTSYITAGTELSDIITDLEDCIMVGLHTCGDLAPNTLRIFTATPEIKAVCSVGCCYHLLSEQYENQKDCTVETWGFPMCQYLKEEHWCCGRNARMSACLALERVAVGQMLPTESLFYRAVLQVIIEECYGVTKSDHHVGKIFSKSSSFLDYVRKSLKKLELDESKLPDSRIMDYYEKYRPRMNELEAFNMLKVVLAPCIEVLILLDRLCYLKEQDNIAWSGLVKLFDPVKSPRCYAVIALKKQQ